MFVEKNFQCHGRYHLCKGEGAIKCLIGLKFNWKLIIKCWLICELVYLNPSQIRKYKDFWYFLQCKDRKIAWTLQIFRFLSYFVLFGHFLVIFLARKWCPHPRNNFIYSEYIHYYILHCMWKCKVISWVLT